MRKISDSEMIRSSGVDWWSDEVARFNLTSKWLELPGAKARLSKPKVCTSVVVMRATRMILTILSHGLPGAAI